MDLSKRIASSVLVALALVVSLTACGEDEPPAPTGGGGEGTQPALIEEGRLIVGSDIPYPPFEFETKGGDLTGFDVEIVQAVAEEMGLENTEEDWVSTDFGTIFQQLASGTKFDVVVAAVTGYAPKGSPADETVADRRRVVDFTVPYYPSLQSLTVNTAEQADIKSVDDLPEGARVGVQRATTGAFYAEENLAPAGASLVSFEKAPLMYQQLQAGQLDAVFNDLPISLDAIENQPDLGVVEQVPTGEEYAIAVAKNNPALLEDLDAALKTVFENGTYAEIFDRYFPEQD
ncbi:MAG: transporter substrate-binding domain-containing protein, partial [Actinomycetota bacterium]